VIFVWIGGALLVAAFAFFSLLAVNVGRSRRASKKLSCPYCGSPTLHASSPKGPLDGLLSYWDCAPYRCEVCFGRHYRLRNIG